MASLPRVVRVTAPSRLHFGLWALGGSMGRQFGGVGVMVEQPRLALSILAAENVAATGAAAGRALAAARRWAEFHRLPIPGCRIEIHEEIPAHAGLGSGTQLALAVAAGLNAYAGLPSQTPQELAISVCRGLRSAVGTYGFVFGGLIVEQGKLPNEAISPLDCRIDVPEAWRFVLIRPLGMQGLAGDDEAGAFAALPEVPPAVTDELVVEIRDRLVPAAATGNFELFANSLFQYGRLSGECFAARQGGPYNGPLLTSLVEQIRRLGYAGVGQSSWGPTVFVAASSNNSAQNLIETIGRKPREIELDCVITAPCNRGAQITVSHETRRELQHDE